MGTAFLCGTHTFSLKNTYVDKTNENITYYVDYISGSNIYTGDSSHPLKTVKYALSLLPKSIDNTVTIYIVSNTTEDEINIEGFSGRGEIIIRGISTTSSEYPSIDKTIRVTNNSCQISIKYLKLLKGIVCRHCNDLVDIRYNTIYQTDSVDGSAGILSVYSVVDVAYNTFISCKFPMNVWTNSSVQANYNSFTSCQYFMHAASGIGFYGITQSGTATVSSFDVTVGGLIVTGSGQVIGA